MDLPSDFHVLVVDDGSPDGTATLVKEMQAEFPRIHILEREGKLGLGTAYIAGFRWALERGYDYIYEMDADFSHKPDDLVRLRQACVDGADVSVGSRYVKDGGVVNWPISRILISKGASLYTRVVLGIGIRDTTSGFKCYRRKVLETIDLDRIEFVGYAFQIAMKYAAKRNMFKLVEVPIIFKDREEGISKMSIGIFNEAIIGVWKMRFTKYKT
jgi:dolichol-phosphate mannosyltransferase